MENQYVFDKDKFEIKKQRSSFGRVVRKIVWFLLISLVMAVLYYVLFALVFSTDTERQLQAENRMYESELAALESKEALLADAVEELQNRDEAIYGQIFHSLPPEMEIGDVKTHTELYDSMTEEELIHSSASKLDELSRSAAGIQEDFKSLYLALSDSSKVLPPMSLPLKTLSYAQVGASVGERINPFYQVRVHHEGLDLISNAGEPVTAAADGVVVSTVRSSRGAGNCVEILHDGGYVTRYKHLGEIRTAKGRKVKKGTLIGYIGMSGRSFAPHLHYELLRDTVVLDPINYFFASVGPDEYLNMLIMSAATQQSMD